MLLRILFLAIGSFIIFDKITAKYKDSSDYTLDLYLGKKRSGKTTILTALAIKYQLQGRKVYSNYYIPGTYEFNPSIIGTDRYIEPNSVLLIDEIGIVFNNRDWDKGTFDKSKIEWFKLQGHYKVKCIIATQSPTDFDKVIRELVDNVYIVKKLFRVFIFARPVGKKIEIANSDTGSNIGGNIVFSYFYKGFPKIYFLPRYTPFFDSFSTPSAKGQILARYNEISDVQADLRTFKGTLKVYATSIYFKVKTLLLALIVTLRDRIKRK